MWRYAQVLILGSSVLGTASAALGAPPALPAGLTLPPGLTLPQGGGPIDVNQILNQLRGQGRAPSAEQAPAAEQPSQPLGTLLAEPEKQFREFARDLLKDGVMTPGRRTQLETRARTLGLDARASIEDRDAHLALDDEVEPPPGVLSGLDREMVSGLGRYQGRMIILLNIESVLDVASL